MFMYTYIMSRKRQTHLKLIVKTAVNPIGWKNLWLTSAGNSQLGALLPQRPGVKPLEPPVFQ